MRSANVVAVVPTFHPDSSVPERVSDLLGQVPYVVVVDDGSGDASAGVLAEIAVRGAELIRLPSNVGIASALNVGARVALKRSTTDYVLTLDQDSGLSGGFVAAAVGKFEGHQAEGEVGIVAPARVSDQPVRTLGRSGAEHLPLEPIQSGMLIARRVFERIGFFREELVIDCVDVDFFLRASNAGLLTVLCADCWLEHALGTLTPTLPGRPGFSHHGPERRFYMTRNRLLMLRENARAHRPWVLQTLRAEAEGLVMSLVFGARRKDQLSSILLAIGCFATGRYGPMPERLRKRLARSRGERVA